MAPRFYIQLFKKFIYYQKFILTWQIKLGFVGINREDFPSLSFFTSKRTNLRFFFRTFPFKPFSKKPFKVVSSLIKYKNYGGCSLTVECETVALETRVQLPPSAFPDKKEE